MTSASAFAESSDATPKSRFQLSYQTEQVQQKNSVTQESDILSAAEVAASESNASHFVGSLNRFDATWLYPVSKSEGMNVDLGVNLRHFDGLLAVESTQGRVLQSYRSTVPMIYASALFDLPFKGLSARVDGGSQINVEWDQLFTSFDYKAAIRYDWDNGIGLEGGWQHRQWQLDDVGSADSRVESKGLFLDLKYKF